MWPGIVQWAIVFGSFGWFGMLFLVFVKIFPSVSMYEVKEMVYHRRRAAGKDPELVLHHPTRRSDDGTQPTGAPA
jgi:molybdopterin-containing oxidoreductase family membrane subunit